MGRRRVGAAWTVAGTLFALVACARAAAAQTDDSRIPWPTHGWTRSTPEEQGIDSKMLADALAAIRTRRMPVHSLLIERHGRIVLDAYFHPFADNRPHNVYSVTKSVVSTLIGIAMDQHRRDDLNAPIFALLPDERMDDARKARITLANLLSMTSGLDCSAAHGVGLLQRMEASRHWTTFMLGRPLDAEPGTAFEYCGGSMHVVSAVLTQETGESAANFARRELFAPLGISHAAWPADADGVSHGFADLRLRPRDMARLGYLWLHHGRWEDRQLVPAAYLAAAFSPHAHVMPGVEYGYGMWIYPTGGVERGAPDFEANGYGGQRIAVVPSLDMVVVTTGGGLDANDVSALIAGAAISDAPLMANPEQDARLESRVVEAALAPPAELAQR